MTKSPNPIEGLNGQLMVTAAHRYCLGRHSYIVGSAIEWLKQWWDAFEPATRHTIIQDTIAELMEGRAGGLEDVRAWKKFAVWGFSRLSVETQQDIRHATAWRKKRWPLN